MKGYFKADADSVAMGIVGASVGSMVGPHVKKGRHSAGVGAALGALLALGLRAAVDPQLKSERAA